jgi:pimeloyl-ACP methyl ester carboxylesterase
VTTQQRPSPALPVDSPTADRPWETFTFEWRGYSIRWAVMGTGQPLLLVHGFGASIGHWRKNIPVLAAAGYRVYALDLLGFGASAKAPVDYSMDLWQALLADFWQAQIQEPTVFVGNSIGGLLCLMMLANHPEMARGGVLLNSAGGMTHRPNELNLPLRTVMGLFAKLIKSPITGPLLFNRIRRRSQIRRALSQVYRNPDAITDDLVELLYTPSCDPGAQQVFASIVTAPPGPGPTTLLPKVTAPLLVLWGDSDPWTPIKGADIYRDHGKNHPVTVIPLADTGHCPHDDRPELVNPRIIEWLATLP